MCVCGHSKWKSWPWIELKTRTNERMKWKKRAVDMENGIEQKIHTLAKHITGVVFISTLNKRYSFYVFSWVAHVLSTLCVSESVVCGVYVVMCTRKNMYFRSSNSTLRFMYCPHQLPACRIPMLRLHGVATLHWITCVTLSALCMYQKLQKPTSNMLAFYVCRQ